MAPRTRKTLLAAHIASSVGWLGAGATFLGLCVIGLTADDETISRSAYLTMEPLCWYVLVPLSVASLLTGVGQALWSPWGLVRHYWVLSTLMLNVVATGILLLFANTVGAQVTRLALDPTTTAAELDRLGAESFSHAVVAVIALLAATVVAVFKPWGRTPFDRRERVGGDATPRPAAPAR